MRALCVSLVLLVGCAKTQPPSGPKPLCTVSVELRHRIMLAAEQRDPENARLALNGRLEHVYWHYRGCSYRAMVWRLYELERDDLQLRAMLMSPRLRTLYLPYYVDEVLDVTKKRLQ